MFVWAAPAFFAGNRVVGATDGIHQNPAVSANFPFSEQVLPIFG